MNINRCKLIDLPKIYDKRGSLIPIESYSTIPFQIKRIYYIYDVPVGSGRGGHAHKELEQLFIAISGSFDVILDDGKATKKFNLNRPDVGLYVSPMIWRTVENFSYNSVCLVIAYLVFDENDYFRSYNDYLSTLKSTKS
jgi:oxalate decarboxylase/phosphoglucose isomerase-like protein (cupin superfamily)